jgi:hypothetical protein
MEKIITMHDEIMEEEWVTGGPLMELSILSYITKPKSWKKQKIDNKWVRPNITPEEDSHNKENFIFETIKKIQAQGGLVNITEDDIRIKNEISLLVKGDLSYVDMKVMITIGGTRKGRLNINLVPQNVLIDSLLHINLFYIEEEENMYRSEIKNLFDKLMTLCNGLAGTIGLESTCFDIFRTDELLMHIGNGRFYGIEEVKWNMNIKGYE